MNTTYPTDLELRAQLHADGRMGNAKASQIVDWLVGKGKGKLNS